jgi:amino acid transporter
MAILSYLIPTVIGLGACDRWSEWGEAHFTVLAQQMGGPWLAALMTFGGLVSNVCLIMVTILGQSRLPMVLAEDRLFPSAFGRVSRRFGTPVLSLLVGGVVLSLVSLLHFDEVVGLFSLVQVLAYVLICAALLKLRSREHAYERDSTHSAEATFRVPLGTAGLVVMMAPIFLLSAFVVVQHLQAGSAFTLKQAATDAGLFASGPLTYVLFRRKLD